jgi:hypothetical protein
VRQFTLILLIFVVIACSSNQSNELEKTFTGELTLTPAESALLCFDRYTELRNNEKEKAKIKKNNLRQWIFTINTILLLYLLIKKM